MEPDATFRLVMIVGALLLFPVPVYFRVKSQASRETLDRRQEGAFILFTLRPIGLACMAAVIAFMIDPRWMAWSSVPLPVPVRWLGVPIGLTAGALIIWTFRSLGPNLTDTVVTRKTHTLVTHGPYRWVRHPFYGAATLMILANSLLAANWFMFVTGSLAIALLVVRTRTEEAKLVERFGDNYSSYMQRTGRFLPRIGSGAP